MKQPKKTESTGAKRGNDAKPGEGLKPGEAAVLKADLKAGLKRKRLLARVAGYVASGLLVSPSPEMDNSEKIATVAVDVAEAILRQVGL